MDAKVVKSDSIIEENLHRFQQALGGFRRRRLLQLFSIMIVLILPIIALTILSLSDGLPWYLLVLNVCIISVGMYYFITLLHGRQSYYKYGCCFKPFPIVSEPHVETIKQSGLIEMVLSGEVPGNETASTLIRGYKVAAVSASGKNVEIDLEIVAMNCRWYLTQQGMPQSSLQSILVYITLLYGAVIGITSTFDKPWDLLILALTMIGFLLISKLLLKDAEYYTVGFYKALDERLAEAAAILCPARRVS